MAAQKVVLITGASSGLGRVTAKLLVERGYCVFGTSRKPEQAQLEGFTLLPLDITAADSIKACVQRVVEQMGRIDVLVNNAGIGGPVSASEEISDPQIRALFETNFFGVVQMTNAVLPVMRQQGGGRIVNVSSLAGYLAAPPFASFYAAAKHALEGYSEGLRYELLPYNIYVSVVEPGYFRTNIDQTTYLPENPLGAYAKVRQRVYEMEILSVQQGRNPIQVAHKIQRIIESEAPALRYPVGLDSLVMSTAERLLPHFMLERLVHWLFMERDWDSTPITKPSQLGIRRPLIDGQFADRLIRLMLAGLVSLFLLRFRRGGKMKRRA